MLNYLLRSQVIRNSIHPSLKIWYAENRSFFYKPIYKSNYANIYHCCAHKTGSQWIRKILSDPVVFIYSSLAYFSLKDKHFLKSENLNIYKRIYERVIPEKKIISPLYIDYETFLKIPKISHNFRVFFILRDPRDVVTSWYFSTLHSHPTKSNNKLSSLRSQLQNLCKDEGIKFAIKNLKAEGLFDAMASWKIAALNEKCLLLHYEDLIGTKADKYFQKLFNFCDIKIPVNKSNRLIENYSFKNLSGRNPGKEEIKSKYRKGLAGDWKNHFNSNTIDYYFEITKDLTDFLGYNYG